MNPFSSSSSSSTGSTTPSPSATLTATPQPVNIIYSNQLGGSYGNSASSSNSLNAQLQAAATKDQLPSNQNASGAKPSLTRKGGVIFPSIKNKPSVANSTFATDLLTLKDVKVRRHCCCFDLLGRSREPDFSAISLCPQSASDSVLSHASMPMLHGA